MCVFFGVLLLPIILVAYARGGLSLNHHGPGGCNILGMLSHIKQGRHTLIENHGPLYGESTKTWRLRLSMVSREAGNQGRVATNIEGSTFFVFVFEKS